MRRYALRERSESGQQNAHNPLEEQLVQSAASKSGLEGEVTLVETKENGMMGVDLLSHGDGSEDGLDEDSADVTHTPSQKTDDVYDEVGDERKSLKEDADEVMVAVPPLPKGAHKSHYHRILPLKQQHKSRTDVQVHRSLGDALQAALDNNDALCTSDDDTRSVSVSELVKRRRGRRQGTDSGEETPHDEADGHPSRKKAKVEKEEEEAGEVEAKKVEVEAEEVEEGEAFFTTPSSHLTPHILNETATVEVGYASAMDVLHLFVPGFTPDLPEVIAANLRLFLCPSARGPCISTEALGKEHLCSVIPNLDHQDDECTAYKLSTTECQSLTGLEEELTIGVMVEEEYDDDEVGAEDEAEDDDMGEKGEDGMAVGDDVNNDMEVPCSPITAHYDGNSTSDSPLSSLSSASVRLNSPNSELGMLSASQESSISMIATRHSRSHFSSPSKSRPRLSAKARGKQRAVSPGASTVMNVAASQDPEQQPQSSSRRAKRPRGSAHTSTQLTNANTSPINTLSMITRRAARAQAQEQHSQRTLEPELEVDPVPVDLTTTFTTTVQLSGSGLSSSPSKSRLIAGGSASASVPASPLSSPLTSAPPSATTSPLSSPLRDRRQSAARRIPDCMVSTTELDLGLGDEEEEKELSTREGTENDESWVPVPEAEAERTAEEPLPAPTTPSKPTIKLTIKPKSQVQENLSIVIPTAIKGESSSSTSKDHKSGKRKRTKEWPEDEVAEYCHQDRKKSFRMKRQCYKCTKRYCVRCIELRYTGDLAYDTTADMFLCPVCKGNCTCDLCTKKRGEVYNSFRQPSTTKELREKPTMAVDEGPTRVAKVKPVKEVKEKPAREVKEKPVKEVKGKPLKETMEKPPTEVKGKPATEVKEKATTVVKGKRASTDEWPMDKVAEYCHQDRTKSFRKKRMCRTCGKRFCVRCLKLRYTGVLAYADDATTFLCPICKGNCNCDLCSRKRGETYVSLRQPALSTQAEPIPRPSSPTKGKKQDLRIRSNKKATLAPSNTKASSKKNPRPWAHLPLPDGPVTYWATMYGLDGERVGEAFVPVGTRDSDIDHDGVVIVRPLGDLPVGQ